MLTFEVASYSQKELEGRTIELTKSEKTDFGVQVF